MKIDGNIFRIIFFSKFVNYMFMFNYKYIYMYIFCYNLVIFLKVSFIISIIRPLCMTSSLFFPAYER